MGQYLADSKSLIVLVICEPIGRKPVFSLAFPIVLNRIENKETPKYIPRFQFTTGGEHAERLSTARREKRTQRQRLDRYLASVHFYWGHSRLRKQ